MNHESHLLIFKLYEFAIEQSVLWNPNLDGFNLKRTVHDKSALGGSADQELTDAVSLFTHKIGLAFQESKVSSLDGNGLGAWKPTGISRLPCVPYKFIHNLNSMLVSKPRIA
jgi:hypothetical protein